MTTSHTTNYGVLNTTPREQRAAVLGLWSVSNSPPLALRAQVEAPYKQVFLQGLDSPEIPSF